MLKKDDILWQVGTGEFQTPAAVQVILDPPLMK